MFRRTAIILTLTVLTLASTGAQNKYDSVTEWLRQFDSQPVEAISAAVDSLVLHSGADSTRAKVASVCYDYYLTSPVMGHEAVALYVADNYFLNGKLEWPDEDGMVAMRLFANFNRSSMIGSLSPWLEMEELSGSIISLSDNPDGEYTYKILYFYDSHCANCRVQTPKLSEFLRNYKGEKIRFYAVYTQSDKEQWRDYATRHFSFDNPEVEIYNLWDPEVKTGYHELYGVLSTPQLFLIDKTNTIIGRKLDCEALRNLLGYSEEAQKSDFAFFEEFFTSLEPVDPQTVCDVVDAFYWRIGANDQLFRNTMYGLYQFLVSRSDWAYGEGACHLAQKYIVDMPDRWESNLVEDARQSLEFYSRNPIGSKATDLLLSKGCLCKSRMLKGDAKATVLYFYSPDCEVCQMAREEMLEISGKHSGEDIRFVTVCTAGDFSSWKEYRKTLDRSWRNLCDRDGSSGMYDKYDLRGVPAIYLLDADKNVVAKGINPIVLEQLLNEIL